VSVNLLADLARKMFAASLAAVSPHSLMRRVEALPDGVRFGDAAIRPPGKFILVALGKASPGLAAAFLATARRAPDETFVLAPDGVPAPECVCRHLRRAGHPLPDARGVDATRDLLSLLTALSPSDGVLALLSGGSSSLLAATLSPIERTQASEVTRALMLAGAPIAELNVVRKHLFAAAGGRLAACCPAMMLALAVSDVPGDDLSIIASGPTVADISTYEKAVKILERRGVAPAFPAIVEFFHAGAAGTYEESPKPGDTRLSNATTHLLGTSSDALSAAAQVAREWGFTPVVATRTLRGEARVVGSALAHVAAALAGGEPTALLAAGETTVQVRGTGRGGRNLEVALAAALALAGSEGRCILASSTDGVDGSSPAAGAIVDGSTVLRGIARGHDAAALLENNDSWSFFDGADEALVTGPTGTNVADLVFVLSSGGLAEYLPVTHRETLTVPRAAR
jgi:glycerate-2-kinase